jgi:predicted nuclease with TOPRIM domain
MLRKKKNNSEYEIDRELTWKFAIEKNAEYQERIAELEEENKNLRDYVDNLDSENDNQAIEIEELKKENKKLKEELEQYKKMFEDHLKECYIKNTAEFMDKKFTLENWFTEEGTLQ